jgi:heme exporter protein B
VNVAWAILWKDLVTEWRSRDRVVAMGLFSVLVVIAYHFALPSGNADLENAPGLLWVAYIFAALLGLNRSFAIELENDALSGLAMAPRDRGWVFLGKATANFVLISTVEAITALVFALVFSLDWWPVALPLAGVVALGTIGLSCAGTLFAAMAVRTRFREVLLPILLLPALFPVLSAAVSGTADLLRTGSVPFEATQLLLVIDGVYGIAAFLLFDYIMDD